MLGLPLMPATAEELKELVGRLAVRSPSRSEATVQADVAMLLRLAPLALTPDLVLEAPDGAGGRIDVEVGSCAFELKRDLRPSRVHREATDQLAGYLRLRQAAEGERYVGVLSDGARWELVHLVDDVPHEVSSFDVDPADPDAVGLVLWLEGVLATSSSIRPTPTEVRRRLGAGTPAHDLDAASLAVLYDRHRDLPTVRLKRELWAKLLTTALGTSFTDEDALFLEHTLLVCSAKIIAHAVIGIDPRDQARSASSLLNGHWFREAQVSGVVDEDFFDWVAEVPGGQPWVKTLARRLGRFAWAEAEHDVMKALYEAVIDAATRHRLGEYYTPDWLAEAIVRHVVDEPLTHRVLDPSCGSGTFLFHAIRHHIAASDDAGRSPAAALQSTCRQVLGLDIHPVAVTLARVTYLLALGRQRLADPDRGAITVPVYLGDSIQWGQEQTLLSAEALAVPIDAGASLFSSELRFPRALVADAGRFDALVNDLAEAASRRPAGKPLPSLAGTFRRHAISGADAEVLTETFRQMCRLHDDGRDHIWGYYVKNLARPLWLADGPNRVDRLVGNPPWLAYRYLPAAAKVEFRAMSEQRGLWAGSTVATNQDLSALFVARSVQLYLRSEGRFGFVMPLAVLSRRQYLGFRSGRFPAEPEPVAVAFGEAWDLHAVKPSFFPVPASVVFGRRVAGDGAIPLAGPWVTWAGRVPSPNASFAELAERVVVQRPEGGPLTQGEAVSPYGPRFAQGATVVPRVLFIVEPAPTGPLGTGAGRRAVRSLRSPGEKPPWKSLPALEGVVEAEFVRPLLVGESLLPFAIRAPRLAVIPYAHGRLLDGSDVALDEFPGLSHWWREAEDRWLQHRSSDRLDLRGRLDYRRGITQQLPAPAHRVVYSGSGMYLAAARVTDPMAIVEHKLYWAAAGSAEEARYLAAVLNSTTLTQRVRPYQGRGEHNPRDFDKYVWRLPIPLFDPDDPLHGRLAGLGQEAEELVQATVLPAGRRFEADRRLVREALQAAGIAPALDREVALLLERSDKVEPERRAFFASLNAGYQALRDDPDGWAAVETERRAESGVLRDGMA